jgi:hypothetical protein
LVVLSDDYIAQLVGGILPIRDSVSNPLVPTTVNNSVRVLIEQQSQEFVVSVIADLTLIRAVIATYDVVTVASIPKGKAHPVTLILGISDKVERLCGILKLLCGDSAGVHYSNLHRRGYFGCQYKQESLGDDSVERNRGFEVTSGSAHFTRNDITERRRVPRLVTLDLEVKRIVLN